MYIAMTDKVKWLGKVYSYGIEETERFLFHDIFFVCEMMTLNLVLGKFKDGREKLSLANIH
jgi:hypothetical protein